MYCYTTRILQKIWIILVEKGYVFSGVSFISRKKSNDNRNKLINSGWISFVVWLRYSFVTEMTSVSTVINFVKISRPEGSPT